MYIKNSFAKIFIVSIASILQFAVVSCGDDTELTDNQLEIRDNVIYQRGKDVPFTGLERAKVEGKIIEYDIVDGFKHGNFKLYYDNGNKAIVGKIEKNINTGLWKYYYETGEIESEGYFFDDLPQGRWVWYYKSGKIKEEGSFDKGKRVAWWYQFDQNGNESSSKNFDEIDSLGTESDSLYNTIEKFNF